MASRPLDLPPRSAAIIGRGRGRRSPWPRQGVWLPAVRSATGGLGGGGRQARVLRRRGPGSLLPAGRKAVATSGRGPTAPALEAALGARPTRGPPDLSGAGDPGGLPAGNPS